MEDFVVKNIFKCLALSALTLVFAGTSHATSYDFGGTRIAGTLFNGSVRETRFDIFANGDADTVVNFNAIDGNVGNINIGINGTSQVTDLISGEVSNTDFTLGLVIQNATALLDGSGAIIGYTGNDASSSGSLFLEDIGDNQFLQADFETRFMNFASYADDTDNFRSELADYGRSNFFLWNSIIRGGLVSSSWYSSTNVLVNGVGGDFRIGGDIHLSRGAEVPEPMTAALLGMGLLGGAIKRKKVEA